jgi:hypothetical protein
MGRRVRWITLTALVSIVGCQRAPEPMGSIHATLVDSAGVILVRIEGDPSELPLWPLSAEPAIEISGDAPPFLASVGEVEILSDGGLLVEDNQTDQLRRFDASGAEVRILAGRGDGPGEFQNLTELSVTAGDTAYAYDRRAYRMSRFAPDGAFMQTVVVGRARAGVGSLVLDGWPLSSERFVLHSLGAGEIDMSGAAHRDQRDAVLHLVDSEGADVRPPISFTGGYSIRGSFGDIGGPFANRPFVSVAEGRVIYGSGLEYEIIVATEDLEPERIVRWSGWTRPLTPELLRSVRDTMEQGFAELRAARPQMVSELMDGMFSPELVPDTLPALGSAMLDDSGRIWVAAYAPSVETWNEAERWHLLDRDGEPLARVRLPAPARLVAARGNQIALVVRDDLDVEHVRVFDLVPAGEAR